MARISRSEQLDLGRRLAYGEVNVDDMLGSPNLDEEDRDAVMAWGLVLIRERATAQRQVALGPAQRSAYCLLRDLLTDEQRRQLRASRAFLVTVPSGRTYRLRPNTGSVARVERHGNRFWTEGWYCLHEDPEDAYPEATEGRPPLVMVDAIPRADRTIGHLLLLLADEERFLAMANWTPHRNMGWDGEWQRRLRERRLGCRRCGERTHTSETCESRRELGVLLRQDMEVA